MLKWKEKLVSLDKSALYVAFIVLVLTCVDPVTIGFFIKVFLLFVVAPIHRYIEPSLLQILFKFEAVTVFV